MQAKWLIVAALLFPGAGYFSYPYATLYQLDTAMRRADATTLSTLVDWSAVRQGLKEDLCDLVFDEPASARPANELAPFGASFVRGVTGNMVDRNFTPEAVVSMTQAAPDQARAETHLRWAFFSHPTRFSVNLIADGTAEPIQMEMQFRNLRWQVRRVWLPNEILERAGTGV